jgi:hypothetical protein
MTQQTRLDVVMVYVALKEHVVVEEYHRCKGRQQ